MKSALIALLLFSTSALAAETPVQPAPVAIPEAKQAPSGPAVPNESKVPEKIAPQAVAPAAPAEKPVNRKPTSRLVVNAPLPSDYVLGSKKAKLIMIEYASLSCPHCAHFSTEVMPDIQKKYIDTGKIRYVLRQYPLNEPALRAAMLVDCVAEKGGADKYYTFNRVLFDAQSKWAFDGNWKAGLATIASVGGVSQDQFESCLANPTREVKILKDQKDANDELNITGTPQIYIGGELYDGPRTAEGVSAAIDAKLGAKK